LSHCHPARVRVGASPLGDGVSESCVLGNMRRAAPLAMKVRQQSVMRLHQRGQIIGEGTGFRDEIALLLKLGIGIPTIARAAELARRNGTAVEDELLANGGIEADSCYAALARMLQLPFRSAWRHSPWNIRRCSGCWCRCSPAFVYRRIFRAKARHRSTANAPRNYKGSALGVRPPLSNIDSYAADDDGFFSRPHDARVEPHQIISNMPQHPCRVSIH
jgi:hypothetical protein